ncbi:coniferyl aldehyde dehydrogenase [Beijerinckia indica]|uniref:Aldehyde dehydrogenase n=1 Tax=Beijerinckia indica subsp. indica (strain ATCC 9039 / DSM 1715 / NCIMB 8712) TaxID=395963 RepID=B2IAX5_BEII9|nr:coniferyl aldehyde dehydrogenase [Beijerinckia indica]ACB93675.1 Aldehyde Dehydrogenase [Beijerinckia indica subsp. indica ATCC 9039]
MNTIAATKTKSQPSEILALQRAAFLRDGPPSLDQRRADLKTLKTAILARRSEIERAIESDFGHRPRQETAIMEIMTLIQGIDYLSRNLRRFMRPLRRHVAPQMRFASARIEYQPLGVIGIMAPWNYPLSLALMPLATAIAAGNRAMLKPSEFTPAMSSLLAAMLTDIFPEEQVAVVTGDAIVGAAFSALPFDHLVFTGSTKVGHAVMRAASDNLVPVTLELGGKSPVVVGKDYPLDQAASGIAYGKLANAGQTCIAPDYAMMPADAIEPFVTAYDKAVTALYPEGPAGKDYTSIINEHHSARLKGLLEDARAKGARVIEVGKQPDEAHNRPHTLAPTVVLGVNDSMRIMQEEIFGPILPILSYHDIDDVIASINARPRPLALYYFGGNDEDRRKMLMRTTSGNVTINNTMMHYAQDDLPFGGIGPSGMGAYHGIEGFRSLSHAKGIFEQGRWNAASLLRPPFGKLADTILKVMLG